MLASPSFRRLVAIGALALALLALLAASARADFGITSFSGSVTADPSPGPGLPAPPETQAGAHPYAASTTIGFNQHSTPSGPVPDEDVKTITVDLPAGFVGNPQALPSCTRAEFATTDRIGNGLVPDCPPASQVGVVRVQATSGIDFQTPIFNMSPPPGKPAQFGFQIFTFQIFADATVRPGDQGITVNFRNINQTLGLRESTFTMWGLPTSPVHDPQRDQTCIFGIFCEGGGLSAGGSLTPFLTNPTNCAAGPLTTRVRTNSWQHPSVWKEASFDTDVSQEPPLPMAVTGCDLLKLPISLAAAATTKMADSPTGLEVKLHVPQDQSAAGLSAAVLKRAVVELPAGMSINPSSADGLGSCTEAQVGLDNTDPAGCPESSKIGSVSIVTPLLDDRMDGSLYLAQQGTNPFRSLLALYLVAEGQGVRFKLAGRVAPDPATGQLVTTFDGNPQLPFEDFVLRFKSGSRAPLTTPPSCGTYAVSGRFSPWSAADPDNPIPTETVSSQSSFEITSGPGGGPCPSGGFSPRFSAGSDSPLAAESSAFRLSLTRDDGTQRLGGIATTLPEGLLASLKGIPYCPETALAAVSGAEGAGAAQIASPSCPAASQVGTVSVGAGAGSSPFYVNTGKAYLAGPYKGAPLSLAVIAPAVAGPFDLGNVVVRNALQIDPVTAQVTAVSDPLPTILHGIPLDLRDVRVALDRPGFTLNPTSCDPMTISGTATSTTGQSVPVSDRFQVADCASLAFKPKLAMRFFGKTTRSSHPRLKATLTMPKSGANLAKAVVLMPKTELLENAHIRTICTRDQWASDTCPKGSIYGKAKAITPLLDKPLEGNVYLRSNGGARELPDLVADLKGQIEIELVGYIDAVNERLRARFVSVPDAPVTKFVLDMKGGEKGLLVHNTNVCRNVPRASVRFDGQNGKVHDTSPVVRTDCGMTSKRANRDRGAGS